jgi:hypothetical protein
MILSSRRFYSAVRTVASRETFHFEKAKSTESPRSTS